MLPVRLRPDLRFHTQVFDFLGMSPRRSTEAMRVLEERQQRLGLRFPAAFLEWYSTEGALDLLAETFDAGVLDSSAWSDDVLATRVLHLPGCDSQAGSHFLRLESDHEPDDPIVLARTVDSSDAVAGPKLTDFIFGVIWDGRVPAATATVARAAPSDLELASLARDFVARPVTRWPDELTRRFQDGACRLTIRQSEDRASWELGADSSESLLGLARGLVRRGLCTGEAFRSQATLKTACTSCQSVISAFDERCPWCGAALQPPLPQDR